MLALTGHIYLVLEIVIRLSEFLSKACDQEHAQFALFI